jgi:hypothetical protein
MATYHRPNLTSAEQCLLLSMVETALDQTYGIADPDFDPLYRLFTKLRDSRPISTERKLT